ncbi:MAG: replication protein [Enterococcus sp.]|nr:replication protein [Enterococcus sp.]
MLFGGVKSYEQVKEITDSLNAPRPERCHNAKAMVRYMAHLDNPDKAQYSISDIVAHGGVDLAEMLRPSSSERYSLIKEMILYIRSAGITEFQDLLDYAADERFDDWFPLLCDNSAFVIGQYIKSQRHRNLIKSTTPNENDVN